MLPLYYPVEKYVGISIIYFPLSSSLSPFSLSSLLFTSFYTVKMVKVRRRNVEGSRDNRMSADSGYDKGNEPVMRGASADEITRPTTLLKKGESQERQTRHELLLCGSRFEYSTWTCWICWPISELWNRHVPFTSACFLVNVKHWSASSYVRKKIVYFLTGIILTPTLFLILLLR